MILDSHFDTIVKYFNKEYPREGCGVIAIQKGKSKWFPCKNVAEDNEDFIIDSTDYIRINRNADIIAVVHSHPDTTAKPSETDVKQCNALNLDYYIISIPEINLHHLKPNRTEVLFEKFIKKRDMKVLSGHFRKLKRFVITHRVCR